jgi:hypothetical protein
MITHFVKGDAIGGGAIGGGEELIRQAAQGEVLDNDDMGNVHPAVCARAVRRAHGHIHQRASFQRPGLENRAVLQRPKHT